MTKLARAVLPLLLLLSTLPAGAAPGLGELAGFVYDVAGDPLDGVDVVIGRGTGDVHAATTDREGRYRFDGLLPGSYLLLATKVGYQAALIQVNTLAASTLDLTLRILGEPATYGAATVRQPEDETWVLRLPPRDVLRRTGREGLLDTTPPAGEDPVETAEWSRHFNAEVQQWFSLALGASNSGSSASNLLDDGRNTAIHLDGQATGGVAWSVDGGARHTAASFDQAALREVDDESRALRVNLNVSPDAHNRVDISAWFDQNDRAYGVVGLADDEDLTGGHRSRTWGYGARWSSRVGESDVDLQLGYGAANLDALRQSAIPRAPLADECWSAQGAVTFSPGERHELRIGMRASVQQHESEDLRLMLDPDLGPAGPVGVGRRGWAVNLFGRESFEITGPLALDIGLDVHHLGYDQSISYILPQAGVRYRPTAKDTIRAAMLMKVAETAEPVSGEPDPGGTTALGYLLAWDRELTSDLTVSLAVALRPYAQERLVDDDYVAFDPATHRALFLSDGSATSREVSLHVEKRVRGFVASTGVRIGQVEGSVISYLPNDLPSQALAYNQVQFVATSLRAGFVPSGTRVSIDYQRIDNESLRFGEAGNAPLTYTSLDVVVQQQIFHHPGRGEWSLMMGYESVGNLSDETQAGGELALLGVADELRRLSGGVAVRF